MTGDRTDECFSRCSAHIKDDEFGHEENLVGLQNIREFIERERSFWVAEGKVRGDINLIVEHFERRKQELEDFESTVTTDDPVEQVDHKWSEIQRRIESLFTETPVRKAPRDHRQVRILFSKTPAAQYLRTIISRNPIEGTCAYQYLVDGALENPLNKTQFAAYIGAYNFEHVSGKQLGSRQKAELDSLLSLRSEWQKNIEETRHSKEMLIEEHLSWTEQKQKEYDTYVDEKENKLSTLEKLYKEKIRYEAPVKEWEVRAKQLRRAGKGWVATLAVTCIGIIVGLVILLYNLPAAFSNDILSGDPSAIKGFLLTITAVSFAVFLVRLFSRFAISAFHLQRDAEERLKLTYVFLGLVKDQSIAPEDRKFFLESIFSRADSGLLKHDSAPEMSGTASILERFTR